MAYKVRGIRGATSVSENSEASILNGTKELLKIMIDKNEIPIDEICSIFFSATNDLNKVFPAKAARDLGLKNTPLICMRELDIENDIKFAIRVLIHVNTLKKQNDMKHIYLNDAKKLRPDIAE